MVLADVQARVARHDGRRAARRRPRRDRRRRPTSPTASRSRHCATRTLEAYGAVHVLCNNAGIGAGAEGRMWEHELNDWRWAIGVNVWGVIHGINAFVPAMLAQGEPGHVVNTSSGNGGVAPLPSTPQYAVDQGGGGDHHRVLYGQLQRGRRRDRRVGAVPRPAHAAHRAVRIVAEPARRVRQGAPPAAPRTRRSSSSRQQMTGGRRRRSQYTPVEEVADRVADRRSATTRSGSCPRASGPTPRSAPASTSMLTRTNPDYVRQVPG